MGRQVKRVALDFDWPLNKVWEGFINPHKVPRCGACEGSGASPGARLFMAQWYGNAPFDPVAYGAKPLTVDHPAVQAFARRNIEHSPDYYGTGEMAVQREAQRLFGHWRGQWSHHLIQADVDALVADGRLWDFVRVPRTDEQREILRKQREAGGGFWLPEDNGYVPTADEVNAWSLQGMGHDAINQWICVKARCKREGVPYKCKKCKGSGEDWPSKAAKKAHEDWKETEPPAGEGWQMWENTSEGSPISPVFETPEALARWLANTGASSFGDMTASYEDWMRMIQAGWAPSAVMDDTGIKSGVEATP